MAFRDQAAIEARVKALGALNGMRQIRVTLETAPAPHALLEVTFWNANEVAAIATSTSKPTDLFAISGGNRLRGGASAGMVQVTSITPGADPTVLELAVAPIGDYSTYTLSLVFVDHIDPLFSSLDFKFRPGCFSIDCAPDWTVAPPPDPVPAGDTLARDYESFRHAMIVAMQRRVPGWTPTSDADLSVTLLDLFAAAADELADYQDRVMNEAYLATARRRVSLARHARLVDYHIHEGNQASTLLAVRAALPVTTLTAGIKVTTGDPDAPAGATFITIETCEILQALDDVSLYTWDDVQPALAVGDTQADLAFASIAEADQVVAHYVAMLAQGAPTRLLIQEERDPESGNVAGRDPDKRQVLRITKAQRVSDPQHPAQGIVRIWWQAEDALRWDFCFVEQARGSIPKLLDVSLFHGNLVMATSGDTATATFRVPPGAPGPGERAAIPTQRWGMLCPLPANRPVLYLATPPDGTTPPRSTLAVTVNSIPYTEGNLVQSDGSADVFAVETDELLQTTIRFGNGFNGGIVQAGGQVVATWRTGFGLDGNVGRDRLTTCSDAAVASVWNPFDATDGRAPEPAEEIRRNAPEAYREHQLRAVTLADYVARAEELPNVQRAAATYKWTGSWRTVRVTIDPAHGEQLDAKLIGDVADHLEALRLIGEDIEIRPPIFVPLRIALTVCLRDDVWPQDVRFAIEQELSDGYTADGRLGLFHPDNWTFGQPLYESEIAGRLERVGGVEHIAQITIQRWDAVSPGDGRRVEVGESEIISVHNDPDHMERGFIELALVGGRQ